MPKQKVFLTGSTGFLGSHLAEALSGAGYHLTVLVRKSSLEKLKSFSWSSKVQVIEGEISDVSLLLDSMAKVDIVIHAAALVSFMPADADSLVRTNVEATAYMVNAAIETGIKQFIFISSIAAITGNRGDLVLDHNSTTDPNMLTSNYGRSKYLAELEVWRGNEEGLPITIFNPSLILGNGNLEGTSSPSIFKYVTEERPFYTQGTINYLDVNDVIEAVVSSVGNEIAIGKRYVLNSGTITNQAFFTLAAKGLGKREPHIALKPWQTETIARLSFFWPPFIKRPKFLSPETLRNAHRQTKFDGSLAEREFGFTYQTLTQTLGRILPQIAKQVGKN
jgi:nucleoside-diphosphate-sugar epimerase